MKYRENIRKEWNIVKNIRKEWNIVKNIPKEWNIVKNIRKKWNSVKNICKEWNIVKIYERSEISWKEKPIPWVWHSLFPGQILSCSCNQQPPQQIIGWERNLTLNRLINKLHPHPPHSPIINSDRGAPSLHFFSY